MADDPHAPSPATWPVPRFCFRVEGLGGGVGSFQEVAGLAAETQVMEHRSGSGESMPRLAKVGSVTLRKGIFTEDNQFWAWYSTVSLNTIRRETVVIKLLDETGAPVMAWTLHNAWPVKIQSTDLKTGGHEVAVESLELVYETLTIANSLT